jgi:hypothetical protein
VDGLGYLGIFIIMIGLVGAVWTGRGYARGKANVAAAQHWLTAPGRVIETNVRRVGMSGGRYNHYVPEIVYAYSAGGSERRGNRLSFGTVSARSRGGGEAKLARYPVGGEVQVRYNPDNPDESVLEPGKVAGNLLLATSILAAMAAGGIAIVVLAVQGLFTADVSGHWHVRFTAAGVAYEGDLEARHAAGPLTLSFNDGHRIVQVREDGSLRRKDQQVRVTCQNPQILNGAGTYSPDDFDLTYQGAATLAGSVSSPNGSGGSATFTR